MWCDSNNIHFNPEEALQDEATFPCASSPSCVHWNPSMTGMKVGNGNFLSPTEPETCEHGHQFNRVDPVSNGWISQKGIVIKGISHNQRSQRTAYYRPTTGPCNCRKEYDGQVDLLSKLDGKNVFYCGFLFHYLCLMLEGKNPLIAFFRASQRSFSIQIMTKPASSSYSRLGICLPGFLTGQKHSCALSVGTRLTHLFLHISHGVSIC